jgi:formylglycine-generating enzyme required for sulfatase activity
LLLVLLSGLLGSNWRGLAALRAELPCAAATIVGASARIGYGFHPLGAIDATPFAVAKFEITSWEWSACVAHGGCGLRLIVDLDVVFPVLLRYYLNVADDSPHPPHTKVSWDKAKQYVAWIAKLTGKPYRLLTEAEWEYAARAGKQTRYSWGDEVGTGNASCNGCGQEFTTFLHPVGQFAPNEFGLYDMHGNVSEWVEDCYNDKYDGAPTDGSAWSAGGCADRVVRGGSSGDVPERLRSASRTGNPTGFEHEYLVGREESFPAPC